MCTTSEPKRPPQLTNVYPAWDEITKIHVNMSWDRLGRVSKLNMQIATFIIRKIPKNIQTCSLRSNMFSKVINAIAYLVATLLLVPNALTHQCWVKLLSTARIPDFEQIFVLVLECLPELPSTFVAFLLKMVNTLDWKSNESDSTTADMVIHNNTLTLQTSMNELIQQACHIVHGYFSAKNDNRKKYLMSSLMNIASTYDPDEYLDIEQ
jgi:hypothetical protein